MSSLFEVAPENLTQLDPEASVDLIRKLIWADATASGISKNLINVPSAIYVNDGGIDGEVETELCGKYGIIKKGITRYQIKSGKFSNSNTDIESILFKDGQKILKDRIKSCLDKDGTLVIAFTAWDDPDPEDDYFCNKFKEKIKSVCDEYKSPKIEIWRQNTIRGFLDNFLALRLDIVGIQSNSFYTHKEWHDLSDMSYDLCLGDLQKKFIKDFRTSLRTNNKSQHTRVFGPHGMGKTRIILEVLDCSDLAPITIYVEDPTKLVNNDFINYVSRDKNNTNIILVVDECDSKHQNMIWNALCNNPSIKLITIFNERDESSGTTIRRDVPLLSNEEIEKILHDEYKVDKNKLKKWAYFCESSPRAAHMLGQNLQNNPDDVLMSSDTVSAWDRCIADKLEFGTEDFKKRRRIMCWISQFKKFGFGGSYDKEFQKIANLVEKNHGIPIGEFREIVEKLKAMKILQGHSTLYITPKILHIYFWTQWWEEYGSNGLLDLDDLSISEDYNDGNMLFVWYCEMFEYAKESSHVSKIVAEIFNNPIFENDKILKNHLAALFFSILSKIDPLSSLNHLDKTIGVKSREELLAITTRREIVWSLERLSKFKKYFERVAKLLLLLADAENETCSNNATGVFTGLFSSGSERMASTEVAPLHRISVLKYALNSDSKYKRIIGIKSCDLALQNYVFSFNTFQYYEMIEKPNLWKSKSEDEIIEYYETILDLLMNQLEKYDDEKDTIISPILDNVYYLINISKLSEKMIQILEKLYHTYDVDNEKLVDTINMILSDKDNLDTDIVKKLERLQNSIVGSDFHSMMKRYVGMDVVVDFKRGITNENDVRKKEIDNLTSISLNPEILEPELKWLVTNQAKNGFTFGYELAKKDKSYSLLKMMLDALKKSGNDGNGFFIGGYLSNIFENDTKRWEKELDVIYDDPVLHIHWPEFLYGPGFNDRLAKKLVEAVQNHKFDYKVFEHFIHIIPGKISEKQLIEWIEILLQEKETRAIFIVIELFYFYFIHRHSQKPPKDITLKLLLHDNILCQNTMIGRIIQYEYYWKEIGLEFIKQYPEANVQIAEKIVKNFDIDNFISRSNSQTCDVLTEIIKVSPKEIWGVVCQYLGPSLDQRIFRIHELLRKALCDNETLTVALKSEIYLWIDKDKTVRAKYVAKFLPPSFELVRDFLIRYGDQDGVKRFLMINFNTEGWSGSAITHYEEKKIQFEKLKENETDLKVLSWLDYYIDLINKDIEDARVHEEREFYS